MPVAGDLTDADLAVRETELRVTAEADAAIDRFAINEALASIWQLVDQLNGYITEQEPWAIAKDASQRERLGTVLATAVEGLRALSVLLHPFVPKATTKLWSALGAEAALGELGAQRIGDVGTWGQLPAGTSVAGLEPLFPRIEAVAE